MFHWVLAALAIVLFLRLFRLCFELGSANLLHLLGVGVITATAGILFVIGLQLLAGLTDGWILTRGHPLILLVFYLLKFISYCYEAIDDTALAFSESALFYLFRRLDRRTGQGMPPLIKMPATANSTGAKRVLGGWRAGPGLALPRGLCTGAVLQRQFVSRNLWIRFLSCVGLHAIWAAAVGLMIWRQRDSVQDDWDFVSMTKLLSVVLLPSIFLHSLYDAALKYEETEFRLLALAAALISFGMLAFLLERCRRESDQRR